MPTDEILAADELEVDNTAYYQKSGKKDCIELS